MRTTTTIATTATRTVAAVRAAPAALAAAVTVHIAHRRRHAREHPDRGAITIEQVGWGLFWAVTIAALVSLFGPWLLARANTIITEF